MSELKAYFLSDTHFRSPDDLHFQKLLKFLKQKQGSQHLSHIFLLGDIFDMWLSNYSYFIERWLPLNTELLRLKQAGVEIHYFEGNHDLFLEQYFKEQLGFHVHKGPIIMKLGPHIVRMEHGDQMDPSDYGYRFLRWVLRTDFVEWLAPRLPGDRVGRFGENMSNKSRAAHHHSVGTPEHAARLKELVKTHAQKFLASEDFFITGHIHTKMDFDLTLQSNNHLTRIVNLGTWYNDQEPHLYCLTSKGGEFVGLNGL
ncbi:MAG: UDP-2,3-diacylglucosamine diphosphatase [Bdellovibrionota bacterium]